MVSEWKQYRLSDVIDLIGGGTPKRSHPEYWGGEIPWLSVKDFSNDYRHIFEAEEAITREGLENSSTKLLYPGQLIISARGTVGVLAQLVKPMAFNQSCYGITAKNHNVINDFLYYLLKFAVANLRQITHGAVFDTITRETFNYVTVDLPPLSEQRAIAHILGSLDDKIELNRQMNETLEKMAQAIFKSWFIDFDPVRAKAEGRDPGLSKDIADLFPDSFEDSELGKIPKGWAVKPIGDVINIYDSKRIPLSRREREKRTGPYPYYGATSIMDYVDDYIFDGIYTLIGEDGSVINEDGTPFMQYVWGKIWVNNHAHVLQGKSYISTEHIYVHLSQANVGAYVTGAVQLKINQGNLKRIPFIRPTEDVALMFGDVLERYYSQYRNNVEESRTLSTLRDTLLPKLISGELPIPDAEKILEGVE